MPFIFSQMTTQGLEEADRCVQDLRNTPIRGRKTLFRLAQANMLAYTFADFLPGYSASAVHNTMPYHEIVSKPLANADDEGRLFFGVDYSIESNAKAKVAGDIFEIVSAAIMWNIAARWNTYMVDGTWLPRTAYPRPTAARSETRQVGVLNLPRDYDWVRLLTPDATSKINHLRDELAEGGLRLPTSTPDLAVVVLPENHRGDALWKTEFHNLTKP
ncbi:MAG: Cfr10I/Bse634I family restriction endonuclease, partial [Streptosporangiaceae bacterium]